MALVLVVIKCLRIPKMLLLLVSNVLVQQGTWQNESPSQLGPEKVVVAWGPETHTGP